MKIKGTKVSTSTYMPTQEDLFIIAKTWQNLSPSFKTLYLQATALPSNRMSYVSPGGHFEIIYSIADTDSVDITDKYRYSSSDWRSLQNTPNGIPDYIDEVAFAADSAWSMEVDRFGFIAPQPYQTSSFPSQRYKIFVRHMDSPDYYAVTYPIPNADAATIGCPSYIELRNEWSDPYYWNRPPYIDYYIHPEKGIRVTCAHEFFHGIQYAMTKKVVGNVWLDDYPVSWTEGSAVLMEDLCFDYVNDYFQYASMFFDNPLTPVLSDIVDNTVYMNSLITMYLYHRALPAPGISFVKSIFFNNYAKTTPFLDNLRSTSLSFNRTWADILGTFYTESYFTGTRKTAGVFLPDSLPDMWTPKTDVLDNNFSIQKPFEPFGMNTFSYFNENNGENTLKVSFFGDSLTTAEKDTNQLWGARCILMQDENAAHDTIIPLPVASNGTGEVYIQNWQRFKNVLVVAANAKNDISRNATVSFTLCNDAIFTKDTLTVSPFATSQIPNAFITIKAKENLPCSLSVTKTTATQVLLNAAKSAGLTLAGSLYTIQYPFSWIYASSIALDITELAASVKMRADTQDIRDGLLSLYIWNRTSQKWNQCASVSFHEKDSVFNWHCPVTSGGTYGVFAKLPPTASQTFTVSPNPSRIIADGFVHFKGTNLLEVWIFSMDGTLVAHGVKGSGQQQKVITDYRYGFTWNLVSNNGHTLSPGVYYARVGYMDTQTKGMKKEGQKVFVLP
jgi:hypothetical protein